MFPASVYLKYLVGYTSERLFSGLVERSKVAGAVASVNQSNLTTIPLELPIFVPVELVKRAEKLCDTKYSYDRDMLRS